MSKSRRKKTARAKARTTARQPSVDPQGGLTRDKGDILSSKVAFPLRIDNMDLYSLKTELRKRKLSTRGNKSELKKILNSHEVVKTQAEARRRRRRLIEEWAKGEVERWDLGGSHRRRYHAPEPLFPEGLPPMSATHTTRSSSKGSLKKKKKKKRKLKIKKK